MQTVSSLREELQRRNPDTKVSVYVNHYRELYEPIVEANPILLRVEEDWVTTKKEWDAYVDKWNDDVFSRTLLNNEIVNINLPRWGQVVKPGGGFTEVIVMIGDEIYRSKYNFTSDKKAVKKKDVLGHEYVEHVFVKKPYVKKQGVSVALEKVITLLKESKKL